MKRTVVLPDLQSPYEDAHTCRNISNFIKAFRPDSLVILGDEIDLPQISRWTENTPGWYEQTLADDRDHTVELLWSFIEYVKHDVNIIRSNHTDRLYNVIMKKIPAFLALPELQYQKFMKFDELGATYWKTPYTVAGSGSNRLIAIHGDEQGINPNAGMTALGAARRHGLSVMCGHTHRAGQSAFTEASGGKIGRILRGYDCGHLMLPKHAGYTKGTMNWQQSFQIVTEIGKNYQVDMIHIEKDGTFVVHGKRYGKAR
jgi:hypothetical protein